MGPVDKKFNYICDIIDGCTAHAHFVLSMRGSKCLQKVFVTGKSLMSSNVRKRTFGRVRLAKIQISLRIRAVLSEVSWGAFRVSKAALSSYGQRRLIRLREYAGGNK